MRLRAGLLLAALAFAACKKPPPPVREPLEPVESVPITLPPLPAPEVMPLHLQPAPMAEDAGIDAGADAGIDAGIASLDGGPDDAGEVDDEPDEPLDAGPCVRDGGSFGCNAACWCEEHPQRVHAAFAAAFASNGELWIGGSGALLHGDGRRFDRIFDASSATGFPWPVSSSDAQPGGAAMLTGLGNDLVVDGTHHFDGRMWTPISVSRFSGNPPHASYLAGPDDLWLVGRGGMMLHGDLRTLATSPSPVIEQLNAIAGTGRNDIWVVGTNSTVLHWDGNAWQSVPVPVASDRALFGVAVGGGEVWIAGDRGTLLRGRSGHFSVVRTGTEYALFAVARTRDGIIAVGAHGTVLRSQKDGTLALDDAGTFSDLHAIAEAPANCLWIAGDDGVLLWKDL